MQFIINNQPFNLTQQAINENSTFLRLYSTQSTNHVLNLTHPIVDVFDSDISLLVSILNGEDFVVSDRLFVIKHLLESLVCTSLLTKLDKFIEENIDQLRNESISIIICRPDLVWNLTEDELLQITQFVDKGLLTFSDIVDHSLSRDCSKGDFLQSSNLFKLNNYADYLTYSPFNYEGHTYQAIPLYSIGDKILPSKEEFESRFNEFTFGMLEGLDWTNVAMMGGSMSLILNKNLDLTKFAYSDVDLFVIGNSSTEREETINRIIQYFKRLGDKVVTYQAGSVVSILIREIKRNFQIIDSGVNDFFSVLDTFDCGISELWFDGKELCSTAIGLFSLAHQVSPIVLSSITHGRVHKQYLRGYTSLLSPNITSSKDFIDDFLEGPLKLSTKSQVIKALNKYLFITGADDIERITSLIQILFHKNYRLIDCYNHQNGDFWLRDYRMSNCSLNSTQLSIRLVGENYYKELSPDDGLKLMMSRDDSMKNVTIRFGLKTKLKGEVTVNIKNSPIKWTCHGRCIGIVPSIETKKNINIVITKLINLINDYWNDKNPRFREARNSPQEMYDHRNKTYPDTMIISYNRKSKDFAKLQSTTKDDILDMNIAIRINYCHYQWSIKQHFISLN